MIVVFLFPTNGFTPGKKSTTLLFPMIRVDAPVMHFVVVWAATMVAG